MNIKRIIKKTFCADHRDVGAGKYTVREVAEIKKRKNPLDRMNLPCKFGQAISGISGTGQS